jgi:hypothetical protein
MITRPPPCTSSTSTLVLHFDGSFKPTGTSRNVNNHLGGAAAACGVGAAMFVDDKLVAMGGQSLLPPLGCVDNAAEAEYEALAFGLRGVLDHYLFHSCGSRTRRRSDPSNNNTQHFLNHTTTTTSDTTRAFTEKKGVNVTQHVMVMGTRPNTTAFVSPTTGTGVVASLSESMQMQTMSIPIISHIHIVGDCKTVMQQLEGRSLPRKLRGKSQKIMRLLSELTGSTEHSHYYDQTTQTQTDDDDADTDGVATNKQLQGIKITTQHVPRTHYKQVLVDALAKQQLHLPEQQLRKTLDEEIANLALVLANSNTSTIDNTSTSTSSSSKRLEVELEVLCNRIYDQSALLSSERGQRVQLLERLSEALHLHAAASSVVATAATPPYNWYWSLLLTTSHRLEEVASDHMATTTKREKTRRRSSSNNDKTAHNTRFLQWRLDQLQIIRTALNFQLEALTQLQTSLDSSDDSTTNTTKVRERRSLTKQHAAVEKRQRRVQFQATKEQQQLLMSSRTTQEAAALSQTTTNAGGGSSDDNSNSTTGGAMNNNEISNHSTSTGSDSDNMWADALQVWNDAVGTTTSSTNSSSQHHYAPGDEMWIFL